MSLLKACSDGNLDAIKAILKSTKGRKSKVLEKDNHNWTCLHHAVQSGNVDCVKHLLTVKELDTSAETFEGETALQVACVIRNIPQEIVLLLLMANKDLVNFVNNEEVGPLQCAIMIKRFDIVKLLIEYGAPVNAQDLDGEAALHIAVRISQLNTIKYLLYETDCNPNICNVHGKTACFMFVIKLISKVSNDSGERLTPEEIECFEELAMFTYDLHPQRRNQVTEIFSMMEYCFKFNDLPIRDLYMKILDLFYLTRRNPRHYFVEKILKANLVNDYCLITLMHDKNEVLDDNHFVPLNSNFMRELFLLFLADESFFYEYISEIMGTGWRFREVDETSVFCANLSNETSTQKLFSFLKVLISYDIDFIKFFTMCRRSLPPNLGNHLIFKVMAPLSSFVNVPLDMFRTFNFRQRRFVFNYHNFNESEHIFNDFQILVEKKYEECQVVSLKNLCRMSIRKHYFKNYFHYKALTTLYSLSIPIQLRNFLCYNYCNFQFEKKSE